MADHAFVCEFCGNHFSNKNNLIFHTRTAKYCISQRQTIKPVEQSEDEDSVVDPVACICGKRFTRMYTLNKHTEKCRAKKIIDSKLESLREEIQKHKEKEEENAAEMRVLREDTEMLRKENMKLKKVVKTLKGDNLKLRQEIIDLKLSLENGKGQITVYKERPGTVNNNHYINPKLVNVKCETITPLTIDYVKQEIQNGRYTYENYIRGEKGLVEFIEALITDDDQRSYVCTDAARNKFHRLIETREWKEDNGANFLNKIFDSLKSPALGYYEKIADMTGDPSESEMGDFLMDKTKKMYFGIANPKSRDRTELFNKIRTEVRQLAAV